MKKFGWVLLALIFIFPLLLPTNCVFASDEEDKLADYVEENIENIDFSGIEEIMDSINNENAFFSSDTFKDVVSELLKGETYSNYDSLFSYILGKLSQEIMSLLPFILTVIALGVVSNLINSFKPNLNSKSISDLLHFVCYALVVLLVVSLIKNVVFTTKETINSITDQMGVLFPILLTLLTAMGGAVSASIYNPMVAVLTNGVSFVFSKIVYPIFLVSFVFVVLGNLTSTVKLNKMNSFFGSSFKWITGFVFTMFAGFLTIQGISAGKYDSISLKATRFAMKNSIPLIGGYLSDGLDYVLLSGVLIKNAVGVASLLLLVSTIISPIIKIVIMKLALQLTAGLIEPIGDGKISSFCESCSKILVYPIVIILALAFMYFLSVGLIMCTITGV